jgi:predicted acetyltransferase
VASVSAPSVMTPGPVTLDASVEIRDAFPEDREQAWNLQRKAFDLPDHPPPAHPGTHEELRVVVRDGRVVSCLTLIHAGLFMHGVCLPMGGVRHVATDPEEQNRGYASALLRDSLRKLRRQGLVTSVLFPFSFRYYRKFGYELGGNHCHFWTRPNCVPAYAERRECRTAEPGECAALARFYAERARQSICVMARDERRWTSICTDSDLRVLVHGRPEIDGYAVLAEGRDSYGGRVLRVVDLAADSLPAWRALLGHLSQFPGESIEWFTTSADLLASGVLRSTAPLREGYKPRGIATMRPMFQFRVVDVEEALRARRATFPEGRYRLGLRIRDELLPANARPLVVHGTGGGVDIREARPSDPYLEMDVQIFSQLFCGYMSLSEALSQGLARSSSPSALEIGEQIFAAGEPFISELDRF